MRPLLRNRLLGLLTLLLFAAGISYQPLCAAGFIDCPPCHSEAGAGDEEEGECPTCAQSVKLAHSAQPSKSVDAPAVLFYVAFVLAEQLVLTAPESSAEAPKPPPADPPVASVIRDIKRSTPIRGPSITA
jgi:hypothetical protein